jgi:hypothetical protein
VIYDGRLSFPSHNSSLMQHLDHQTDSEISDLTDAEKLRRDNGPGNRSLSTIVIPAMIERPKRESESETEPMKPISARATGNTSLWPCLRDDDYPPPGNNNEKSECCLLV